MGIISGVIGPQPRLLTFPLLEAPLLRRMTGIAAGRGAKESGTTMIELKIDGITCNGCIASVKRALVAADPAATAEIDLASGAARIETQLPRDRVVETIEAAGYDVVAG